MERDKNGTSLSSYPVSLKWHKEKATILETESSTSWLEQLKNYDFDTIIRKTRENVKDEPSDKLFSRSEQNKII